MTSMQFPAGLMVSVSGVRGVVGTTLTPELVARFAGAFGTWARRRGPGRTIVVGRDSRVSGPLFHRVVIGTLQAVGCDVIDIGMAPTPTVQLAVEHHHAAGGLAITASHNPIEWNALKFIGADGLFLDAESGAAMRAVMDAGPAYVSWEQLGAVVADDAAVARHIAAVLALPYVDVAGIRAHRFRVALDCCHGAGGVIMPQLLAELGCEVFGIGMPTDGRFPRPPEPVAEQLGDLVQLVRTSKAAVGLATDPDVDRLAVVDETGRAIGEDWTLALAAKVVLGSRVGPVVTNLSTSRILDDIAAEAGTVVTRAPVGEVNVALAMQRTGAVVGGEGNGGVILPDLHLGRDAPAGAALVLQLMHQMAAPVSAIVGAYPRYAIVKDKLDLPRSPLDAVYSALRGAFADAEVDLQDGLRVTWADRWLHVRPSGTEPIVRVIAEGPDAAAAQALVDRARVELAKLA
jgi:phosphomannomutase